MPQTNIIQLRHELHKHPEVSGQEYGTAKRLTDFLKQYAPSEIIQNLGGTGVGAVYRYGKGGKSVVVRCELDALPIVEQSNAPYQSQNEGVSHMCGHDGHMAIVASLAPWLAEQSFGEGQVTLLYQPAEETGQGAERVVNDPRFQALNPDMVIALHNIPQEPMHNIILCERGFSAEVISFVVRLIGLESHASQPEKGRNPAVCISELIQQLDGLNNPDIYSDSFATLTPVHINMGQVAYGISPGDGELHYTIRTWSPKHMSELKNSIVSIIEQLSSTHNLEHFIDWLEYFPACTLDADGNELIANAANENGFTIQARPHPFRFGEDFGWYAKQYNTAFFGLGSGLDTAPLHNPSYDFPDEIIATGHTMFREMIKCLLSV